MSDFYFDELIDNLQELFAVLTVEQAEELNQLMADNDYETLRWKLAYYQRLINKAELRGLYDANRDSIELDAYKEVQDANGRAADARYQDEA